MEISEWVALGLILLSVCTFFWQFQPRMVETLCTVRMLGHRWPRYLWSDRTSQLKCLSFPAASSPTSHKEFSVYLTVHTPTTRNLLLLPPRRTTTDFRVLYLYESLLFHAWILRHHTATAPLTQLISHSNEKVTCRVRLLERTLGWGKSGFCRKRSRRVGECFGARGGVIKFRSLFLVDVRRLNPIIICEGAPLKLPSIWISSL